MSRKVFTAGEVLAAADVNSFLMDQTVMSFADTAARGSAIPSPVEGMYTHLEDSDNLQFWNGSAWTPSPGLTHLRTTTVSGLASQTFDNVFSATYDNYLIVFSGSITNAEITFNLRAATVPATGSNYVWQYIRATGGTLNGSTNTAAFGYLTLDNPPGGGARVYLTATVYSPFLAQRTLMDSTIYQSNPFIGRITTEHGLSNSYDGFSLAVGAGSFTGPVSIYGYRK
jgi:hypothetical protein